MKIGIIGWDHEELESLLLERKASEMGHSPLLFTLDEVTVRTHNGRVDVLAGGVRAAEFDVIISRAQLRPESWYADMEALTLLSELEGVPMLDPAYAYAMTESKLTSLFKLAQAGLPVPPTNLCSTLREIRTCWEEMGPIVVKPSYGLAGTDVERIDDDFEVCAAVVQGLLDRYGRVLVQPFLPHPGGDLRVTVIGDQVGPGCFRRIVQPGKWKANVALGAIPVPFQPDARACEIAIRAARVMGMTLTGLDLIEYQGDYMIIEINTVPGMYPLPKEGQEETAARVIAYAVERAHQAKRGAEGHSV